MVLVDDDAGLSASCTKDRVPLVTPTFVGCTESVWTGERRPVSAFYITKIFVMFTYSIKKYWLCT
jgi:hypothetical protein